MSDIPLDDPRFMDIHRRRLFNAIRMGNIDIVREVLGYGVDPDACNRRGQPAIVCAVRSRCVESGVVDVLLDAGADAEATDVTGLNALDLRGDDWHGSATSRTRSIVRVLWTRTET